MDEYVENAVIKVDPEIVDLPDDIKEEGPSGMKKPRLDELSVADLEQLKLSIKKEMSEIMQSENFDERAGSENE